MLNLGLIDTPWIPAYRQAGRIEIFHTLHFVQREKSLPGNHKRLYFRKFQCVCPGYYRRYL